MESNDVMGKKNLSVGGPGMDSELSGSRENLMTVIVAETPPQKVRVGSATKLVKIDFRQIAGLPARDFYRILALAIVKEIAKSPQVQNVLNIPLPSTAKEFRGFLENLDSLVSGYVMLLLSDTELLSEAQIRKLRKIIGGPEKGRRVCRLSQLTLPAD
jgi:hypothetical protein